jgi:hypothetical protein
VSAAAIVGQNHADFLAESRALKWRTVASASCCAPHFALHPHDVVMNFVVA